MLMENYKAVKITVNGRVQGVGFRPFIFSLAEKYEIKGTVQNNMDGVKIFAEGKEKLVREFIKEIRENPPRISRIDQLSVSDIPVRHFSSFTIVESERSGKSSLVIPIDTAVCHECLTEMEDPSNFRYQYPFINCTQCGPRYTIIRKLPYDRPFTTMESFQMCGDCTKEYVNHTNRRHHAQPIACPKCGPIVSLKSMNREVIKEGIAAIDETKKLLKAGMIVAIKGLGGYHLACDASNDTAVKALRKRKKRPKRPLAIMAKAITSVEKLACISIQECELLQSPEAPIVVVQKKVNKLLQDSVAPGMNTIGVFLPYTPLHKLLFSGDQLEYLVMTSANPSGLPMLYKDDQAFGYLAGIADFILTSNREIEHPIDDSVVQFVDGELQLFRRARGYVPDPIFTERLVNNVIALGPQQKNTFSIGRFNQIFIGPHIGDMGSIEMTNHYLNEFRHLIKWLGVTPTVVAIDMHPLYETKKLALEMEFSTLISVQHHHAHHVACMEDNQLQEPCLGIILDGTGYGEDGNIWGFELLYGDASSYERLGHLAYYPLPGAEKAVKEPWRNAIGLIISQFGIEKGKELTKELFPDKKGEIEILATMVEKNINSPLAGTCGRLFDAISAIIGVCQISTYDGEAAVRLSELINENNYILEDNEYYSFDILFNNKGLIEISIKKMISEIICDIRTGKDQFIISLKFHETIAQMCCAMINEAIKDKPTLTRKVVLSGGSFHNRYLTTRLVGLLKQNHFQVFTHKKVPCNDGGISLGQLLVSAEKYLQMKKENDYVCRGTRKSSRDS